MHIQQAGAFPGTAYADVTICGSRSSQGWTYPDLLDSKPLVGWYDLAANGVNHPNDFGHLLCAQVMLATLAKPGAAAP